MSARRRFRTLDYKRRLQARLARQDEDARYAIALQGAALGLRLEGQPFDYSLSPQTLADIADAVEEWDQTGEFARQVPPPTGTLYGWPK